jgi:RNA polymerase sigma factor for flagellar operon FliA
MTTEERWENFGMSRSPELRKLLVAQYIGLVKYVAQHLYLPAAAVLESQDVLHFGILGLHEAVERFDPKVGVKFETYAIPRIKGMILDELRRVDTMPRSVRDQSRKIFQTASATEQKLGREATHVEIAQALKMGETEYHQLLALLQSSQTVSLDDFIADEQTTRHEIVADASQNVEVDFEAQEAKQTMVDALKRLPRRERLIVTLYYYEGATFDEIGRILGVSESRVSQIHSKILNDLRQEMEIRG